MVSFVAVADRLTTSFPDMHTVPGELEARIPAETRAQLATVTDATLDDIALAWAAGLGSKRAVGTVEPLFAAAEQHLRARGHAADVAAEATQRARVSMLTGEVPTTLTFAGRGALGAFVRVVCVRQALQHGRDARRRALMFDDLATTLALDASDPELEVLHSRYRDQVNRAMIDAWAKLSKHDRFVLSLHLHARHSISEIATVYGIHRVNAARKLAAARSALIHDTRLLLQGELGVSAATASSVLRLVPFGLSAGNLAPASNVPRAPRGD